jgi:hypothetical protein
MEDSKVAVSLEDLRLQFRNFCEGLQVLNEKVDNGFGSLNNRFDKMEVSVIQMDAIIRQEHQQIMRMIYGFHNKN